MTYYEDCHHEGWWCADCVRANDEQRRLDEAEDDEEANPSSTCACESCGATDNLTYIDEWPEANWWCAKCIQWSNENLELDERGVPIGDGKNGLNEDPQNSEEA